MMNLQQALDHGDRVGVRFYIYNSADRCVGGTKTLAAAQAMKTRFEIEDRRNPWTKGTTRFYITEVRPTR